MMRGEDSLQKAAVDFCRVAIKRPDRYWFVPNGANLSKAQAGKFKAMGLTPGVSDLHFAWATGSLRQFPCFGCIELKWGRNTETTEQEAFGADLAAIGHTYAVCRTVEEVERTLRGWGVPLHATVLPSGVTLTGAALRIKRA